MVDMLIDIKMALAKGRIAAAIDRNKDSEGRFIKGSVWVELGNNFSKDRVVVLRRHAQACGAAKVVPKGNRSAVIIIFKRCKSIALSLSVFLGRRASSARGGHGIDKWAEK